MLPKLTDVALEEWLLSFERMATVHNWPIEIFVSIIAPHFVGKMLRVYNSMPLQFATDYKQVKEALLRAFQQTAHTYRTNFRNSTKTSDQSYVDYAFNLTVGLDKWLGSRDALTNVERVKEVIVQEQLIEKLPTDLKTYASELKLEKVHDIAVALNNYTSLHKSLNTASQVPGISVTNVNTNFRSDVSKNTANNGSTAKKTFEKRSHSNEERSRSSRFKGKCFACNRYGHKSADCRVKDKQSKTDSFFDKRQKNFKQTDSNTDYYRNNSNNRNANYDSRSVHVVDTSLDVTVIDNSSINVDQTDTSMHNLITTIVAGHDILLNDSIKLDDFDDVHPLFKPFVKQIQLCDKDSNVLQLLALRDSAALQSLISESVPSSFYSFTGDYRLIKGVSGQEIKIPLVECNAHIPGLLSEIVQVGLVSSLPKGVSFLLSNDLWMKHKVCDDDDLFDNVITRSMSKPDNTYDIDISQLFDKQSVNSDDKTPDLDVADDPQVNDNISSNEKSPEVTPITSDYLNLISLDHLRLSKDQLIKLQQEDCKLVKLSQQVVNCPFPNKRSYFYVDDGVLMHARPVLKTDQVLRRVVIPRVLVDDVLRVTQCHDDATSGQNRLMQKY
jgi:hypothetical protein